MTESIFDIYWRQVEKEIGGAPTRTRAIRLSGNPLDNFNGPEVIGRLSAALSCDGWKNKAGKNWNWDTSFHYTTDSPEVRLERELVRAGSGVWARQMATSSGVQGHRINKRRAIDLVCKAGEGWYSFIELKVESDNPLFALFELLGYGLAYLHAKANDRQGTGSHDVMAASLIDLVVLAPCDWYVYKKSRSASEQRFDFEWLVTKLNEGLKSVTKGKPSMRVSFREFSFQRKSIPHATKEILRIASDWNASGKEGATKNTGTKKPISRKVVVNVSTTGLLPADGERVIELAALEMVDDRLTGRGIYTYLSPEREIHPSATDVHGITAELLEEMGGPKFEAIAKDFVDFVRGAELIAHNVSFHVEFLDSELARVGFEPLGRQCPRIVDTLRMARTVRAGMKNSLDALRKAYKIKKPAKTPIGAKLDASLTSFVYLALSR